MVLRNFFYVVFLLVSAISSGQASDKTEILHTVLKNYYKSEKPVIKGRGSQFLFLYCQKANNNEEIFQTVYELKLPKETVTALRKTVESDTAEETWTGELDAIYATDKTNLKARINDCLSVPQYQERRAKQNLNNQRMLIVHKPLFYENGTKALVKIVFYRTIEHNSGVVLLMEKSGDSWTIKEFLNKWET